MEGQLRSFFQLCQQEGHTPAATFIETEPGTRPGYKALLDYLHLTGPGAVIVAWGPTNLGESLAQALERVLALDALGSRLVFIDGDSQEPLGRILKEWGTSERGQKIRSALKAKATAGYSLGRPPFGYKVAEKGQLAGVPTELAVVRLIFSLYVQGGLGIRRIANRLNEGGYRTRTGNRWSMHSVRNILSNSIYAGDAELAARAGPGQEPSVSQDAFQRVQERLKERPHPTSPPKVVAFALRGLAFCGYCGEPMVGATRRKRWQRKSGLRAEGYYRYYRCRSGSVRELCNKNTWREGELEKAVRDGVRALLADDSSLEAQARKQQPLRQESPVASIDSRLRRALEKASKGLLPLPSLRRLLEQRRRGLEPIEGPEAPEQWGDTNLLEPSAWTGLNPVVRRNVLAHWIQKAVVWTDRLQLDPLKEI
ncbi:MAG: recombinase family protein [Chloroflexi bacterium]|nr:recombinase family protein [Chloroflexota bacterium]